MDGRCWAIAVAALASLAASSSLADVDPAPGFGEGSHEQWVKRVDEGFELEYQRSLAAFAHHRGSHPEDRVALLEECRFIDVLAWRDEGPVSTAAKDRERCREQLKELKGVWPEADLYFLETTWEAKDVAASEALLDRRLEWTDKQLARAHHHLASAMAMTDPARARAHALTAVELDQSSPARLQAAQAMAEIGAPDRARSLIVEAPVSYWKGWPARSAAALLLDLHDPEGALRLLRTSGETPGNPGGPAPTTDGAFDLLLARALAASGAVGEARALLEPLASGDVGWTQTDAARAAFDLELDYGSAEAAKAAYDRWRSIGLGTDPFARHRISLFLRHPWLGWALRDVASLALMILLFAGCALAPALLIGPVHYRGLVLRLRGAAAGGSGEWSLRHAWVATAALLASSAAALLWFAPDTLGDLVGLARPPGELDEKKLAHVLIAQNLLALVVVVPMAATRVRGQFLGGSWGVMRCLLVGGCTALVLRGVAVAWAQVIAAPSAAADPLGSDVVRAMTGCYVHHGALALVLLVAVAVPILEELVFRGIVVGAFAEHVRFRTAAVLQALLFAAAHDDLSMFPFFAVFGLLAVGLRARSGALLAPLIMHASFNGLAVLSIAVVSSTTNR